MFATTIRVRSEQELHAFGVSLAKILHKGDVLALNGPLGAGKTTVARGIIKEFCGIIDAPSPTFPIVLCYEAENEQLWHFDAYRLDNSEEIWETGLGEALNNGVVIVEWAARIEGCLPENALTASITIEDAVRLLHLEGVDGWRDRLNPTLLEHNHL